MIRGGRWHPDGGKPFWFRYAASTVERRRHIRKYAAGDLGEDKSFWFRGPAARGDRAPLHHTGLSARSPAYGTKPSGGA